MLPQAAPNKITSHPIRVLLVLTVAVGSLFLLLSSRSHGDVAGKPVHLERGSKVSNFWFGNEGVDSNRVAQDDRRAKPPKRNPKGRPHRVLRVRAEQPREKSMALFFRNAVSAEKGARRVRKYLTEVRHPHMKERIRMYYYAAAQGTGHSPRRLQDEEQLMENITAAQVADLSQNVSAEKLGEVLNEAFAYVDYHYFDVEYSELEAACDSYLAGETSVTIDMTTTSGEEVAGSVTNLSLTGCGVAGGITEGSILYHTTEYVIECPDTTTCQVSQRITGDELETGAVALGESGQYPVNESLVEQVLDQVSSNETAVEVSRRRRRLFNLLEVVGGVALIAVGTALIATGVLAPVGAALITVGVVLITWSAAGCYPKLSVVWTRHGPRPISAISVGDTVRVFDRRSGRLGWSDVYMQGHAIDGALGRFISLTTATNVTVSASRHHFLPVVPAGSADCHGFLDGHGADVVSVDDLAMPGAQFWVKCVRMTRARNVGINDWVLTSGDMNELVVVRVKEKRREMKVGMYNPHTKSGTIVVNGVVGSVHAETVFDAFLPASWDPYLPDFFQWAFSPLEFVYDHFRMCAVELDGVHKHGLGEVSVTDVARVVVPCVTGKVLLLS